MEKSCSKHCFSTNVIIAALEGVLSLEPAQIPEVGSVERRTRTLTRRMTPPQSCGSRAPLSFGPRSFKKKNKKKKQRKEFCKQLKHFKLKHASDQMESLFHTQIFTS